MAIMYIEYLADNSTKVISLAFFSPKMNSEDKHMKKVYLKVSLLLYILIISGFVFNPSGLAIFPRKVRKWKIGTHNTFN